MEKNTIWFVVVSVAFLLLWYKFFPPVSPVRVPAKPPISADAKASEPAAASGDLKWMKKSGKIVPVEETEKTIESEYSKVVMDSQGAFIKHWWVKEGNRTVDLVHEGQPMETFPNVNFEQAKGSSSGEAEWKAVLPSGVECIKKLTLSAGSPFAELTLQFKNPSKVPAEISDLQIGWEGGLGTVESEKSENLRNTRVLAYPTPEKEVKVFKAGTHEQNYHWAGIDNRYYFMAMFPEGKDFNVIEAEKSKTNFGMIKLNAAPFKLAPGESKNFAMKIYAGTKGYTYLKSWNMGLENAVDFGYFGFLGRAALKAMYSVYKVTKNYGIAIILLTLGLQVIVFPLTLSSYKSMAIMKRLQPKMQDIQTRYKDDPKRLSSEMMSLYKEAGTTPFSGCLPMMIQMPVFIAFFTMLRNSYELHGAPFAGWIHDLSKADPFYVLPVLTGAIMFLQQRVSGSNTTDPTQKQMMTIMPIVFTFVFLKSPSGLALYWLTNSLVSMTVQTWASRKYAAPAAPALARR